MLYINTEQAVFLFPCQLKIFMMSGDVDASNLSEIDMSSYEMKDSKGFKNFY